MTRRAAIRTDHEDAAAIAAAVRPDNTAEMETDVEEGKVVTRIARETTGGLRSTVDDYVVNVDVATAIVAHATAADRTADDATTNGRHADRVTRITSDDTGDDQSHDDDTGDDQSHDDTDDTDDTYDTGDADHTDDDTT